MSAAAGADPVGRLPADDGMPELVIGAPPLSTAADDAGGGAAAPQRSVLALLAGNLTALPQPLAAPADAPVPQQDDEASPGIARPPAPELEQSETKRVRAADAELAPSSADAGAADNEPAVAAAVHARGSFGSPVIVGDAVPAPSPPDNANSVGHMPLASAPLEHSFSETPDAVLDAGPAAFASDAEMPEGLEDATSAAAHSGSEIWPGSALVSPPVDALVATQPLPPVDVLAPMPRRSIDDSTVAPAFGQSPSLEVPPYAPGRSSIDSYAGGLSTAMTSCSSDALTAELLLSDDEDRPRSGWPLMLRWRFGTPGLSPVDDAAASDAPSSELERTSLEQSPPAPSAAIAPAVPLAEELTSRASPSAAGEFTGQQSDTALRPAADLGGEGPVTEASEQGLTSAAEDADQQDREQTRDWERTEALGTPADPAGAPFGEAAAAGVPSAADVAERNTGARAEDVGDDGDQWRVSRASRVAQPPPAAVAARYQRSESSPAAAIAQPPKVSAGLPSPDDKVYTCVIRAQLSAPFGCTLVPARLCGSVVGFGGGVGTWGKTVGSACPDSMPARSDENDIRRLPGYHAIDCTAVFLVATGFVLQCPFHPSVTNRSHRAGAP